MMKIAVASENGMVTEHFGHCEAVSYTHLDVYKRQLKEQFDNP